MAPTGVAYKAHDLTKFVRVEFSQSSCIGSGGHGNVYRGELTTDINGHRAGLQVAVKTTRHGFLDLPENVLDDIERELAIWSNQRHANLLPLIGIYMRETVYYGVAPYCDGGTLNDYLATIRTTRTDDVSVLHSHVRETELLSQVAAGLAYLHGNELVHGDIKGSNILVDNRTARLADYGLAVLAKREGLTSSEKGTTRFNAPDFYMGHGHRTQMTDMWAFGCVVVEARTGLDPFAGLNSRQIIVILTSHKYEARPYTRPLLMISWLWDIAEGCWSPAEERLTADGVNRRLAHLLEYFRTLHKAFEPFPGIKLPALYSSSRGQSRRGTVSEPPPVVDVVRVMIETLRKGHRYRPAALRPALELIAGEAPAQAEKLMIDLSSPYLGEQLEGHPTGELSVAFLADGRRLLSASRKLQDDMIDTTLRLWQTEPELAVETRHPPPHTPIAGCATHGSRVATCSRTGTLRVWDADSGMVLFGLGPFEAAHPLRSVRCIAFSGDGLHLATGGDDNVVTAWNASTGAMVRQFQGHGQSVTCVAFSPSGKNLVSGSEDGEIRLWGFESGQCIKTSKHSKAVTALRFTPDNKYIYYSSLGKKIRVFDANLDRCLRSWKAKEVMSLALSPDGQRIVSGSRSGTIALRDVATGRIVFRDRIPGSVCSVEFSPDGRKLVSGSTDGTIQLWDATIEWKRCIGSNTSNDDKPVLLDRKRSFSWSTLFI